MFKERIAGKTRHFSASGMFAFCIFLLLVFQALCTYAVCHSEKLLLANLLAILLLLIAYLAYMSFSKDKNAIANHEAKIAFLLIVLFGLAYMIVMQPGSVPDEPYHFQSSYKLSNTLMMMPDEGDTIQMRADIAAFLQNPDLYNTAISGERYGVLANAFEVFSGETGQTAVAAISSFDFGSNPPQLKLASAIGIVIARFFGLGAIPLFYAGRIANLLFFAFLLYWAVRVTPIAKKTFIAVALLPMTLQLAASYSYDAGIIGLGMLLTALLISAIYGKGEISTGKLIAIAVMAALLAPCKVIYAVIIAMIVFIPASRFKSSKHSLLYKASVLLVALLSIMVLRLGSILTVAGVDGSGPSVDFRGTEQGTFYTLGDLASDPLHAVAVYLRTFAQMGDFYLSTTLGCEPGWFQQDLFMPDYVVVALVLFLVVSTLVSVDDKADIPAVHRVVYFLIFFVVVLAAMASMFLGWTFNTENVVQGVQGRYFLPALVLLLLSIRTPKVMAYAKLNLWVPFLAYSVNVVYLGILMSKILV